MRYDRSIEAISEFAKPDESSRLSDENQKAVLDAITQKEEREAR